MFEKRTIKAADTGQPALLTWKEGRIVVHERHSRGRVAFIATVDESSRAELIEVVSHITGRDFRDDLEKLDPPLWEHA